MEETAFTLDESAEMLFQQIDGVDFGKDTTLGKALSEEEKRLHVCRGYLGELVHLLGTCLNDVQLVKDAEEGKKFLSKFLGLLSKIGRMPDHDGKILIRFRGLKTGSESSERVDYVVLLGNMVFDMATAASMVKNLEDFSTDFETRLTNGFQVFSEHGINSLFLQIPDESPATMKALWMALVILSQWGQALSADSSVADEENGSEASFSMIPDEQDQPDLNLTILAKINRMKPETMKALIQKVETWMARPDQEAAGERFSNVYNAILGNKALQKKLVPPPMEVNNIKWLMVDDEYEVVSKEKTDVARLVMGTYGDSPQETARIMGSVYGDDYEQVDSQNLGERLKLASNLLASIEETDDSQPMMEEVLENVEKRLDEVSDDTYDSIEVEGGVIKAKDGETEKTVGKIHSALKGMVGFFKARSVVNKKMENLAERGIIFDDQDYKVIAKDFEISKSQAKDLIETFQNCFDEDGSFLRDAFSRNVSKFAKHRKKIFQFLWHYLQQMSSREDRVALLNSLQMLIPHLKHPQGVLKVLLTDFSKDPDSVAVSDRSALVLITLLISNYTKEHHQDIEITPEEVLGVTKTKDLDTKMIAAVTKVIDGNRERFFQKFRTVHRKLNELLVRSHSEGETISLRDIFLLEREVYIFLSLISGNTARVLIRSAAGVYGDPRSGVYQFHESEHFLPSLLQLLKITSRGLGRIGERKDLSLLQGIRDREGEFYESIAETGHSEHLKRAMEVVQMSMERIDAAA